jgi:hypothetical protein
MSYALFHCVQCVWCSLYYRVAHIFFFCNHIPLRPECFACKTHDITSLGTWIVLSDNVTRSLWYPVSCLLTIGSLGSVTIVREYYVIMKLPCWSALLVWKGREVVTQCFGGINCLHPRCWVNQVKWRGPRSAEHKRWLYIIDQGHAVT